MKTYKGINKILFKWKNIAVRLEQTDNKDGDGFLIATPSVNFFSSHSKCIAIGLFIWNIEIWWKDIEDLRP